MAAPKFGTVQSFQKDEIIFAEGQIGDVGYLVKSGEVSIYKIIQNEKKVLATLGHGEVFGEIGIITESPRTAWARAKESCELVVIDRETLYQLLKKSPKMIQSITLLLLKRLANTLHLLESEDNAQISARHFYSVCCLLDLMNRDANFIETRSFCSKAADITRMHPDQIQTVLNRLHQLNIIEYENTETDDDIDWDDNQPPSGFRVCVDRRYLIKTAKEIRKNESSF